MEEKENDGERPLVEYDLVGWVHEDIDECRLYWKQNVRDLPKLGKNGFEFRAFDWCGAEHPAPNIFDSPDVTVQNIARGRAAFDGLRHVWFGEDGYLNYPDSQSLVKLMARVAELEREFCWDCEQNRKQQS